MQVSMHVSPTRGYTFEMSTETEADLLSHTVRLTPAALGVDLPRCLEQRRAAKEIDAAKLFADEMSVRRAVHKALRRQFNRLIKYCNRLGRMSFSPSRAARAAIHKKSSFK